MIVLSLEQEVAASPYFIVHHVQRRTEGTPGWVVSGTLGDGWYEGEVAVEVGSRQAVTFADDWIAPAVLAEFFQRVDREQVCDALYRALAEVSEDRRTPPAAASRQRPHWHGAAGHGLIASGEPLLDCRGLNHVFLEGD